MWAAAHLRPLSIGLHHQHDTRVRFVERVSVQQSLAGHTQLHLGDAGGRTAEAGCRGGGLLDVIHPGSERDEQPTSGAVQRQTSGCEAAAEGRGGVSAKTWRSHTGQLLPIWHREEKTIPLSPVRANQAPRCKNCLSEPPTTTTTTGPAPP